MNRLALAAAVQRGRRALIEAGISPDDAERDAALLARGLTGWSAAEWLVRRHDIAPPDFADRFFALIARRAAREPIAYITGEREFYGRPFTVTPQVLIPRPETELLVEEARRCAAEWTAPTILDLGTGSGCIAVTLALECPDARVIATDDSAAALAIARANAVRLGASHRIEFREGAYLAGVSAPIDLLVSNPPYVAEGDRGTLPRDVADYEPAAALFGGADGLDVVRCLVPLAARGLAPAGWLLLEIGQGQDERVREIVAAADGLTLDRIRPDLQGIPRVVVARRRT